MKELESRVIRSGKRIKGLRKRLGLTQVQLVEKLPMDVGNTALSDWESGKREPSTENAVVLAQFFKVTVDYLLCAPGADKPQWVDDSGQRVVYPPEVEDAAKYLLSLDKPERRTIIRHLPKIADMATDAIEREKQRLLEYGQQLSEDGLEKWELDNGVKLF